MQKNTLPGILFILCICFIQVRVTAQSSSKIAGRVIDAAHRPIEAATVILQGAKDTIPLQTMLTDSAGNFSFDHISAGRYRINITLIGYIKYKGEPIAITGQNNFNIPAISLVADEASTLKSVSVTASQKPFVEQKVDRTVVNVNALISNTGSNALEVLQKSPGVQVDEDGNITFKGKSGVLVMIDDKPTYLSAADLVTYLKSLPASALEKIELMDNPPAKYDAAGNAGVINIKTKKTKTPGFNGTISSNFGHAVYNRFGESANLNYHVNKINVFTNISYNNQKSFRRLDVNRDFYDALGDIAKEFRQSAYFRPVNHNINILGGIDYYLSPKTTWGIAVTRTHSITNDNREVNSSLADGVGKLDSTVLANNTINNRFDKKSANLNFSHSFDSSGRQLSFDLDYINYGSTGYQSFLNNVYMADNSLKTSQLTIDTLPSAIHIYSAKIDYTHPLPGKAKISAGAKSSIVNADNAADYYNVVSNISSVDYGKTNHFLYRENINAAYLNYNKEFKYFSLQTGLRLENTISNGHQLGNAQVADSSFSNHYFSLFPTAYFTYKLDTVNKHSFAFSYGRRISRPNYQDLNPFVSIIDKFTYFSGNPFLRPQFTSNYKLSYMYKSIFTASLVYNHSTDVQIETIEQKGDIFVSHTGNVGQQDFLSINCNLNAKPVKWWTLSAYTELNNNKYSGPLNSGQLNVNSLWMYGNINSQFNLPNGWSTELNGFYLSAATFAQFVKIPSGAINLGVQKKILKDKGTIKLSLRDIARTIASAGDITNVPNTKVSFKNTFDTRAISIGFIYAFGTEQNKEKRKTGGADSEAARAGN